MNQSETISRDNLGCWQPMPGYGAGAPFWANAPGTGGSIYWQAKGNRTPYIGKVIRISEDKCREVCKTPRVTLGTVPIGGPTTRLSAGQLPGNRMEAGSLDHDHSFRTREKRIRKAAHAYLKAHVFWKGIKTPDSSRCPATEYNRGAAAGPTERRGRGPDRESDVGLASPAPERIPFSRWAAGLEHRHPIVGLSSLNSAIIGLSYDLAVLEANLRT